MDEIIYVLGNKRYSLSDTARLHMTADALNPYGRAEYRIVECVEMYGDEEEKNLYYGFWALLYGGQTYLFTVRATVASTRTFYEAKKLLSKNKPVVVRFSDLYEKIICAEDYYGLKIFSAECELVSELPEEIADIPYYCQKLKKIL